MVLDETVPQIAGKKQFWPAGKGTWKLLYDMSLRALQGYSSLTCHVGADKEQYPVFLQRPGQTDHNLQ